MRNKWIPCLTILALLAGFLPAVNLTLADGPDLASGLAQGDDFLISLATGDQSSAALAYNDDLDEYLVVWADKRGDTHYGDIYGQFVSNVGVPQGDNFVICDETDQRLENPDVTYDTLHQRYLVVWENVTEHNVEGIVLNSDGTAYSSAAFDIDPGGSSSDRRTNPAAAFSSAGDSPDGKGVYVVAYQRGLPGDYDIFAQFVHPTGGNYSLSVIVCMESGDQTAPDVAGDSATGKFLIVWEDGRATNAQIYGRRVHDPVSWGTQFVISAPSVPLYNPAVAFSPDAGSAGEWLVVYQREDGDGDQIRGRRVTAAGDPTGNGIHICDASGDQWSPDVAYNADSKQYLVVWEDRVSDLNYEVYGRRVDVAGSTAGDVFAIRSASGRQNLPAVAASTSATDPGYLVAFYENATGFQEVSGQRVGTGGALKGHSFIISAPLNDQTRPAIAYNSQEQAYLVVWQDERAGNWDIYGLIIHQDGYLLGYNFAICSNTSDQILPDVTYNPDTNQYLVVWEDHRTDADIYGQRVDANGWLDGGEVPIAGLGATARRRPRVAFNPISGEYLVVYAYAAENGNVRGRRVPASGNPTTAAFDIATGTATQDIPDVACRARTGGGGYLVVWRETTGTSPNFQRDVRGQRLGQAGSLQGSVLDICTEAHSQWSPRVAYSPDADHYLVVWPDDRDSATQGRNVYGRRVGGAGVLKDELAISTAAEDQKHAAVAYSSGLGDWVVAWDDARNAATTPDLYAQRVNSDGTLADTAVSTNDLLFEYAGWQQFPALAWSDTEKQGLVTWQDGRNGDSFLIYGLQLGAGDYTLYLPLVLRQSP